MASSDFYRPVESSVSYNRNFQNEKATLAGRVDKNEVIKGYETKKKILEEQLAVEILKNGKNTKLTFRIIGIIKTLNESIKREHVIHEVLNGNQKKGK